MFTLIKLAVDAAVAAVFFLAGIWFQTTYPALGTKLFGWVKSKL